MNITTTQLREIREVLAAFGLKEKEHQVYIALLQSATTTTTPLSRKVHLPVTTTESILERLATKGLIEITKRKSRHLYTAADPAVLRRTIEEQLEEMKGIIPLLETLKKEYTTDASVRVFYRERFNSIFDIILADKPPVLYEIVAARPIQDILGERYRFTRRRVTRGIRLKSLRVEKEEIKKYSRLSHERELREAKFLPRELSFRASLFCWNDTVAIFTTRSEGTALVIKSPVLFQTFQQLFMLLWSISRTMENA